MNQSAQALAAYPADVRPAPSPTRVAENANVKLQVEGLHKSYGDNEVLKGVSLKAKQRRRNQPDRRQRLRQKYDAALHQLSRTAGRRGDHPRRRQHRNAARPRRHPRAASGAAAKPAHATGDGVSTLQPVEPHDRAGEHHHGPAPGAGGATRKTPKTAHGATWTRLGCRPGWRISTRRFCPVASNSAWRLPGRWRWSRR